jgi:hypothetical protein
MPNMANIVVKAADGTTDVTYTAQVASAGDKSPAVWRGLASATSPGFQPEFRLGSRWNGSKASRVLDYAYSAPTYVTSTDTGAKILLGRINFSGSCSIPQLLDVASINEFTAEMVNLIASSLSKQCLVAGYAPV